MTGNDFVFIQQALVGKANGILQEIATLVEKPKQDVETTQDEKQEKVEE